MEQDKVEANSQNKDEVVTQMEDEVHQQQEVEQQQKEKENIVPSIDEIVDSINMKINASDVTPNIPGLIAFLYEHNFILERFVSRNYRVFKKFQLYDDEEAYEAFMSYIKKARVVDPMWNDLQLAVVISESGKQDSRAKKLVRRLVKTIESFADDEDSSESSTEEGGDNVLGSILEDVTKGLDGKKDMNLNDIFGMVTEIGNKFSSKLEKMDPNVMMKDLGKLVGGEQNLNDLMNTAFKTMGDPSAMQGMFGAMAGNGAANTGTASGTNTGTAPSVPINPLASMMGGAGGGLLSSILGGPQNNAPLTAEQKREMEEFFANIKI